MMSCIPHSMPEKINEILLLLLICVEHCKVVRGDLFPCISGVGSGVAPGARAPPCWIVLESFHKRETCFVGRIFCAWSGGPSLVEPLHAIERAWLCGAI